MNALKKYYSVLVSIFVFLIYLLTIAPSVIQIDSGELAAVQLTLGIAHPTGYPLFTILGYLFSLVPLPFTKIFQMNLLAAIYTSAAIGIFITIVKTILDNLDAFNPKAASSPKKTKKTDKKKKEIKTENQTTNQLSETKKYIASIFSGLVLAFSKTFWFQSTSVEVYSLHLFLICSIIFVLIKAYLQKEEEQKIPGTYWFILAAVLALGFSNHMTTLLILPALAFLFFNKLGINKNSVKKVFWMIAVFLPILILLYSYLPIRASQQPELNWGNPIDLERILRHISGKQYQVWLFSSMEAAKKQFGYFFSTLTSEFNVTIVPIVIGVFAAYFLNKKIFVFWIIVFASTVLYSINYDIVDIDSYFLLAYISLSFFAAIGLLKIYSWLKFNNHKEISAIILSLVFILVTAFFNFKKVDQSKTEIFEDYTKSLINSMDKKSMVLSYQWDFFISASYYFQHVENFRRDVIVIDKELLRRSWYFNQLERNFPGIFSGLTNEVNLFLEALKPFERSENYNPQLLESLYRQIMTKLVTTNFDKYNIYIAPEIVENEMQKGEFLLPEDHYLVPDLFLFRVVKTKDYIPANQPNFRIRLPKQRNYYINFIENQVGGMLARRAVYEMQFDRVDKARVYINKIKNDLPEYKLSIDLQRMIE